MPENPPRRVNYFFGKVMGVEDFEAEQSYLLDKHRRHNRHLHGWGVICGLAVAPSGAGVVVEPGLALDGLGREIVVPEQREMPDPRQPIDDQGEPCGPRVDSDQLIICLAYAERPEGSQPGSSGDEPAFVVERFRLEVRPGRPEPPPRSRLPDLALVGSAEELARVLCEAASRECPGRTDECIPIATVDLSGANPEVESCPRRIAYPTDLLLELVLGLADRVRALETRN
jgi:hypothetical protein